MIRIIEDLQSQSINENGFQKINIAIDALKKVYDTYESMSQKRIFENNYFNVKLYEIQNTLNVLMNEEQYSEILTIEQQEDIFHNIADYIWKDWQEKVENITDNSYDDVFKHDDHNGSYFGFDYNFLCDDEFNIGYFDNKDSFKEILPECLDNTWLRISRNYIDKNSNQLSVELWDDFVNNEGFVSEDDINKTITDLMEYVKNNEEKIEHINKLINIYNTIKIWNKDDILQEIQLQLDKE